MLCFLAGELKNTEKYIATLQPGLGLGNNSMEARKEKHQKIERYEENTTFQNKWHEFFNRFSLGKGDLMEKDIKRNKRNIS